MDILNTYRKTWWLTRPVRTPIAHDQTLQIFAKVALGKRWERNKELHFEFERELGKAGIKRERVSDVGRGSGGRTWASLLRAFGYWYPSEADRTVILTPVAEALIRGNRVKDHVTKQIMCYQIPNAYFLFGDFRERPDPTFKIFPFRFLLKMLLDQELMHLTLDEIALFVVTAKTSDEFSRIKNKILYYRKLREKDGKQLKERIDLIKEARRAYNHRRRKNAHLDPKGYLDFVRDIANTFMINLEFVEGIERSKGAIYIESENKNTVHNLLDFFEKNYPFSSLYKISERAFAGHYGLELGKFKYSRKLGPPVITPQKKALLKIRAALNEIFSQKPAVETGPKLVGEIEEKTGLKRELVRAILELEYPKLVTPTLAISEQFIDSYMDAAKSGIKWREFEDMTMKIFEELDFKVLPHLPAKLGEEIDGLLLDLARGTSGVLECKSGEVYTLTPKDRDLMLTTYLPNFKVYRTLEGVFRLDFFLYVVGGKFKGESNLQEIVNRTQIRGSIIQARQLLLLLDLFRKRKTTLDVLEDLFKSGTLLNDTHIIQAFEKDEAFQ